jgi:hypothetical protein
MAGLALVFALGVAAGLAPQAAQRSSVWELRRTTEPRRTGVFRHVDESSGVTASRRYPGILWTLNDSGNQALIFATDTLGRDHGVFTVTGAENRDWEAIALGPCGTGDCLYIADTGDNARSRKRVTIYRVAEPVIPARAQQTRRAEALEIRYPRGGRDVEAAFVDPTGAVYLIGKGTPSAYRIPPEAWRAGREVTAKEMKRLPIDAGSLGSQVTDAALAPSGNVVAVRTYLAIYLFVLTAQGSLVPTGVACDAAGLQLQGEGITWLGDRVLVLTSEGGFGTRGTIVLLECGDAASAPDILPGP